SAASGRDRFTGRDRRIGRCGVVLVAGLPRLRTAAGAIRERRPPLAALACRARRRGGDAVPGGARAPGARRLHPDGMRAMSPAISFAWSICSGEGVGLWTFDLWITLPLLLAAALYAVGIGR